MSEIVTMVERYMEIWNEPDDRERSRRIDEVWTEDGTYTDPLASVTGRRAINGLVQAVRDQFPGFVFRLAGTVDAHHDLARFTWAAGPDGAAEPLVVGFDVARTGADGRITAVYGFLDRVPAA